MENGGMAKREVAHNSGCAALMGMTTCPQEPE